MPESHSPEQFSAGVFGRLVRYWNRRDWLEVAVLAAAIGLLHLVGFGTLVLVVAPHRYQMGAHAQVFGIGLGVTAYTFGLRHAFDIDHIAAIDNTTRKLTADGKKPKAVGFWFAMGHSMLVLVLAVLVIAGAQAAGVLFNADSSTRHAVGVVGTLASGGFLYLIGIINVVGLIGIWSVFRAMRRGQFDEGELEDHLNNRGFLARILRPIMKRITRPVQMFPVGVLFGLGFDTATEVALLGLAGSGAATGLPWYAVLTLPIVFAAGMSLMDTADGLLMTVAYDWVFAHPARKIFYNLTITGFSVAIALLIGTIELISVLHDNVGWINSATDWISALNLNNVSVTIVGLFIAACACAIAYWRLTDVEHRWQTAPSDEAGE